MNDLISREAAMDALEWKWAGKAAIDAIKQLPPAQRWIPVTERLPEDDGRYLVTIKEVGWFTDGEHKKPFKVEHQRIHIEDFFAKDQSFFRPLFTKGEEIVAWMPLPGPFKEG